MPRPEKVQAVAAIKERLEEARAIFVAEYSGLSVKEQQELRRGLREADSEFKVLKMTLTRLAASELGHDELVELLVGPTGLTFANDAAATAKVLRDFSKDHQALVIKGALLGGEVLPPEKVAELADIEPRDVLLAKIAGALQAPMAKFAGMLAAMPRDMATMLQQLIEKTPEEADPEPPAEEGSDEPAEEAPAADAGDAAPAEEAAADEAAAPEAEAAEAVEADSDESDDGEDDESSAESSEAEAEASAEDSGEDDEATTEDEPADEAEEE